LNPEFENILAEAKKSIEEDGYLELSHRMKIWKAFGADCYPEDDDGYELYEVGTKIVTPALRKRVKLAKMALDKVLHIWDEQTNNDPRPHKLIKMVESYLVSDKPSQKKLRKKIRALSEFAWNLENEGITHKYRLVLVAVTSYAWLALTDMERLYNISEDELTDSDYAEDYGDTERVVGIAVAMYGNPIDGYDWDKDKRKDYWLWYVNEAVPTVIREGLDDE